MEREVTAGDLYPTYFFEFSSPGILRSSMARIFHLRSAMVMQQIRQLLTL